MRPDPKSASDEVRVAVAAFCRSEASILRRELYHGNRTIDVENAQLLIDAFELQAAFQENKVRETK